MKMVKKLLFGFLLISLTQIAVAAQTRVSAIDGDFRIRDFRFGNGESLPELRLHYRSLAKPVKDDKGVVRNAVLILHGTGGSGRAFLSDQFGGVLFGKGQLLDSDKYFIILPDGIGHGGSSKPSNGLHARFPHYGYRDMVAAQHRLLTEGLRGSPLRLVLGTSMGAMHTWLWGERYPDFMDALRPLTWLPMQISGRNRMLRRMVTDAIRSDPEWNNGEYKHQPRGLVSAIYTLSLMGWSPLQLQKQAGTRDAADKLFDSQIKSRLEGTDAN